MVNLFVRINNFINFKVKQKGIKHILKVPFIRIITILKMFKFTLKIKSVGSNCNIEKLVDFAMSSHNSVIKLHQIKSEIIKLLKIIKDCQPKAILEIGTLNGGTLFLFSRIIRRDGLIISIDYPKGKLGHFQLEWRVPLISKFSLKQQELKLLRANSHNSSTLYQVKKLLEGRKLDFIFFDGDHTYEGVKKDFEMYSPFVRKGGILAFHDIISPPGGAMGSVNEFWEEVKNQFEFQEFIEDIDQGVGGIGLLIK